MWKASNTEKTKASAQAVWQAWEKVSSWPDQDKSINAATINGPFAVGGIITIKPKGSPKVKVVLKRVEPNKGFMSEGKLPLTKMQFIHEISSNNGSTSFTQSVVMDGPLAGLFSALMGKKMEQNLVARMKNMKELLEA